MQARWKLLVLIVFVFSSVSLFAEEPPLLKPKRRSKQAVAQDNLQSLRLEIIGVTPLGKEDFYESRFSTFGGGALISFPFTQTASGINFYGSFGFLATLSQLTLNQGADSMTSIYFQFPILARATLLLNPHWSGGVFAGLILRTTRYDSRNTADGGFQKVPGSDFLQPEAGVELAYLASKSLWIKMKASYLFLGLGVEFGL